MQYRDSIVIRAAAALLVLMSAGLAGGQTNSAQRPTTRIAAAAARTVRLPAAPALSWAPQSAPAAAATAPVRPATNAEPSQAGKLLQTEPHRPFLETVPELAFSGARANEMDFDRYSLSGVSIQLIKAKNPLQLINPVAPAEYGSGADNVEWFPASLTGPGLKLFSINF